MALRAAPWFAIFFLLSLAATFPMRIAAGWAEGTIAARDAEGSIWAGRLVDLRAAGLALGSPDAVALPVSIPGGEPVLSLKWNGEGGLSGRAAASAEGLSIDRFTGLVDVGGASSLPLRDVSFQDFSVRSREGRCGHAAGTVKARLTHDAVGPLAGIPRCNGTALLLPLQGGGRTLTLRVTGATFAAELRGPTGVVARQDGRLDGSSN